MGCHLHSTRCWNPAFLIIGSLSYHAKSTRSPRLPERGVGGTPEGPASDAGVGWLAVEVPLVSSVTPSMALSHASCSDENGGELGSIWLSLVDSMPSWHKQRQQLR